MAQQARPNVAGQMDERRAQLTIFSTVVVRMPSGTSSSSPMVFFDPLEDGSVRPPETMRSEGGAMPETSPYQQARAGSITTPASPILIPSQKRAPPRRTRRAPS